MKTLNDFKIIGIDHGYGNIKTANCCFPTGVIESDTEPPFTNDLLIWNNRYYSIGVGHKEFTADKFTDEDYYILTLAAIARELNRERITNAKVYIAAGLPLTWVTRQKEDFKKYLLQHRKVDLACTIKPFDFEFYLRSLGYQFVRNFKYQHPSVIGPDWKKPVRLSSLGKDYSREAILRRLQSQREDKYFVDFYTPQSYYQRQPLIVRIRDFEKKTEPDVITALFDLIITIAKLITGNNVQKRDYRPVSPELRAEIRNLDRTLEEYHFLCDHNVKCAEDFVNCRNEIAEQIKMLESERQHLRNQIRRAKTPEEDNSLKEQCKVITKELTPLRKQLIICGRIENKVPRLRALIKQEKQLEQGRYKYKYYHQNKTKQSLQIKSQAPK